jgi:hypothetical protein
MKSPLKTLSVEGKMAVTSDYIKASSVTCNIFVTTPATFYLETQLNLQEMKVLFPDGYLSLRF